MRPVFSLFLAISFYNVSYSQVNKLERGGIGSAAIDFSTKELHGDSLRLSTFKGKYVLLDFWASWCKPCRAGNPELVMLYSNLRSKGIEFIGISDDDFNEVKWKEAIEKDGITKWKHILRGHGPNIADTASDINKFYGVHTIPTKILINPKGTIIGRFGDRGEPHEKLSMVLNELLK